MWVHMVTAMAHSRSPVRNSPHATLCRSEEEDASSACSDEGGVLKSGSRKGLINVQHRRSSLAGGTQNRSWIAALSAALRLPQGVHLTSVHTSFAQWP